MLISFKTYLAEEKQDEKPGEKLGHIEHLEDHPINDGAKGFQHSIGALDQVHHHIISGSKDASLTMKHDGSPSIVYGYHPETGKFFVATKSAFNKAPKINYSEKDIDKNHGHAPGLAHTLKQALEHLPKVSPKSGVFHGDVLFADKDKSSEDGHVKFRTNTITYSAKKDSEEGKKIHKAKFGVYTHTSYHGKSVKALSANYNPDLSQFKDHKDVYHRHPGHDTSKVRMSPSEHKDFETHTEEAQKIHNNHGHYVYDATKPIKDHLKSYIHHTVRTQEKPSIHGLRKHLEDKFSKEIDKKKTPEGKKKYQNELKDLVKHLDLHKTNIENVMKIHHHLSQAKDTLVHVLARHTGDLTHEVSGQKVKPEGFVVSHQGKLSKLNDRNEFNRLNFLARKK